ncbi:MAG: hypothetical protein AB8D52_06715 [Gammaproteobacteria bacterium]
MFFIMYVLHALVLKEFALSDAFLKGGYEFFWRFISFQIFIQFCLLVLAANFGFQKNYFVILILSLLAFSISSILSFSGVSSIWILMQLPSKGEMGEGLAIFFSVTVTFFLFRLLDKGQ